jgi:hypothetical protein
MVGGRNDESGGVSSSAIYIYMSKYICAGCGSQGVRLLLLPLLLLLWAGCGCWFGGATRVPGGGKGGRGSWFGWGCGVGEGETGGGRRGGEGYRGGLDW